MLHKVIRTLLPEAAVLICAVLRNAIRWLRTIGGVFIGLYQWGKGGPGEGPQGRSGGKNGQCSRDVTGHPEGAIKALDLVEKGG
jgi:hypothetical protein